MKSIRMTLAIFGLLALPLVAAAAQGRSDEKCKNPTALSARESHRGRHDRDRDGDRDKDRDRDEGHRRSSARSASEDHDDDMPWGQEKKCPPAPPPAPSSPPTGPHSAVGTVFEDIDGNGSQDLIGSEFGLVSWTVELHWNGQVIASTTTGPDGSFIFETLGNTSYEACVVVQAGYRQTAPVGGNGCSGNGFAFSFNSTVPAQTAPMMFGVMLQ